MRKLFISALAFLALPLFAQKEASIRVYPQQGTQQISKHIYGQFAEHLGTCIYGGWVPTLTYLIHKGIVMMCSTP